VRACVCVLGSVSIYAYSCACTFHYEARQADSYIIPVTAIAQWCLAIRPGRCRCSLFKQSIVNVNLECWSRVDLNSVPLKVLT